MTWLDCDTEARTKVVTNLKYRDRIVGRKNFSDKWITGADSVRTINVRDHTKSDQHAHAMNLHRRELARSKGLSATAYSPIASQAYAFIITINIPNECIVIYSCDN